MTKHQHHSEVHRTTNKPQSGTYISETSQEELLQGAIKGDRSSDSVITMQQTLGNQFVMRHIKQQPSAGGDTVIQRGWAANQVFGSSNDRNEVPDVSYMVNFDEVQTDETVAIASTDNVKLKGHWYEPDLTRVNNGDVVGKTVLFLSGSGGSAEKYGVNVAYQYLKRGANVLLANYRGFGGSKKEVTKSNGTIKEKSIDPSQQGLYDDARAMFDWLGANKGVDSGNVIVHGYSLGGAVAANLVATLAEDGINIAGLVMHSAMPSTKEPAKDAAEELAPWLKRKWARKIGKTIANMSGTDFTTDDKFQRLAAVHPDLPMLFISGDYNHVDSDGDPDGDHLADTHTGLSGRATGSGMNNVSVINSTGNHFNNAGHISAKSGEFDQFLQSLTPDQVDQADAVIDDM